MLPNLSVHVVFSRDAPGVWPPSRGVFSNVLHGKDQVLGVRMRPGCCGAVLGRSVNELGGERRSLGEVFGAGAGETQEAILRADSTREMVASADRFLRASAPRPTPAEQRVAAAVERVAGDPTIISVRQLSAATGMPTRTLQRLFVEHVGVGPKWAIRVYRINEAAKRAGGESRPDWATIAAELGYSDQAHFTRDFTAAVGISPATYRRMESQRAEI